jgi:hypothetical protein
MNIAVTQAVDHRKVHRFIRLEFFEKNAGFIEKKFSPEVNDCYRLIFPNVNANAIRYFPLNVNFFYPWMGKKVFSGSRQIDAEYIRAWMNLGLLVNRILGQALISRQRNTFYGKGLQLSQNIMAEYKENAQRNGTDYGSSKFYAP